MTTTTAQTTEAAPTSSGAAHKAGLVLTVLVTLFLAFDSITHILNVEPVREANEKFGAPAGFAQTCGIVLAVCLIAYLIPRTAVIGAILLTAYLGGAVCANLLTEQPLANTGFALITAALVWGGLWPRDQRVRAIYAR